ncbi:MAG: STAS domain-containing protein [Actinobacteria bacterium]|nr:STAS domain-containing protein [Actinomycetota bacterium]
MEDFSCRASSLEGSAALISVSGELDLHTCEEFRTTLDEARRARPRHLIFDLTEVTYIDSTALGVLLVTQRQVKEPLHLVVGQRHQRRLLRLTGLDEVFAVHETLDEAVHKALERAA